MFTVKRISQAPLVLSVLLVACAMAGSFPCLPATCPTTPVEATFQHANCTGSVTYIPFSIGCGEFDITYDEHSLNFTSRPCDSSANPSYERLVYLYGICNPERGTMILYNVNDTVVPQRYEPVNANLPTARLVPQFCYSVENCTALQPAYFNEVYSSSFTCPAGNRGYAAFTNVTLNTCYRETNYRSKMFSCAAKPLTYQWTYYYGSACTTLAEIREVHNSCSSSNKNTYCVGRAPSSSPVAAAPNAAEPSTDPVSAPGVVPATPSSSPTPFSLSNTTSPTPSSTSLVSPSIFLVALISLVGLTF